MLSCELTWLDTMASKLILNKIVLLLQPFVGRWLVRTVPEDAMVPSCMQCPQTKKVSAAFDRLVFGGSLAD